MIAVLAIGAVNAEARTVIFGGASEYRPFHFLDRSGQPDGFDVALFEEIAREAGWNTEYRLGDWSATQQQLLEGEIDVVPMFISDERQEKYLFSTPVLKTSHYLFGREGGTPHDSLYELSNEKVAAEEGGYGWRRLQQLQSKVQIVSTRSEAEAIHLVDRGTADYALVNGDVGTYIIDAENLNNVTALSPPLLPVVYAFAVNPERPGLVSGINRALQDLRQQGIIDELSSEWLAPAIDWREALQKSLWIVIPLLLAVLYIGYQLWRYRYRFRHVVQLANSESARRQEAERQAEKLAVYDELTGLPNTTFFLQYLNTALEHAREHRQTLAAAILTLLDMEIIQQVAGYRVTDGLIKLEAEALAREYDGFIAYLGQGRYGFIFENIGDAEQALGKIRSLLDVAGQEYDLGDTPIEPHVACGMAVFPEHGYNSQDIYRAAELAMTMARQRRQPILSYDPSMEPDPRNLTLMADLRKAIEANVLDWVFQPKYSLFERRVIGAEMLIRWRHPRYGPLSPGLFIPLAEKTGLIQSVTRCAIAEAIGIVREWGAIGSDWKLSVNVSGNDLADSGMVNDIIKHLDDHASLLVLEVTETAIIKDIESISRNIERLRVAGIGISLDDYGTGFSSLSYLKQLSFDEIKIDMSFIKNMLHSDRDQKITRASIILGHELDATVTAEGVEDMATAELLETLKCDALQGYGIAKPGSQQEFIRFADSYIYPA
ncbi:MAG: EAL domain-containing protein [Gammaproteobacteria bacterium]|nr:EAL domain-containing protein [Gammaproteobacteria bacterium]